jgi:2-polyprenyl-6-methoxyphenol hydroxylase-like FAD-dependent oxidoreductase
LKEFEMTKVLISGAGIAGPALAYWLRRYGFEPTVVEVAPGPRPGGQTVDIRGVARDVVDRMGLMPAIRGVQMHEKGLEYVRANGRRAVAMLSGTALSLVGAYVLAGELARNGDHVQAFAAYQRVMQGYVEQRMELPPGGIELAMPNSAAAIWARNASTRLMTSRPFRGVLAKLATAQPDAIDLPDYLIPATPNRG